MVKRYNRYERARIIGARALQISLGAPILVKLEPGTINPVTIALMEFSKDVIPITVTMKDRGKGKKAK